MLVRVHKGGDQRPVAQLYKLSGTEEGRQLIADVDDFPVLLHQILKDSIGLVDSENVPVKAAHQNNLLIQYERG